MGQVEEPPSDRGLWLCSCVHDHGCRDGYRGTSRHPCCPDLLYSTHFTGAVLVLCSGDKSRLRAVGAGRRRKFGHVSCPPHSTSPSRRRCDCEYHRARPGEESSEPDLNFPPPSSLLLPSRLSSSSTRCDELSLIDSPVTISPSRYRLKPAPCRRALSPRVARVVNADTASIASVVSAKYRPLEESNKTQPQSVLS